MMKRHRCHDCGVVEGQLHVPGCDMEKCPFCGNQLITCGCCYTALGFEYKPSKWVDDDRGGDFEGHPTCGLPKEIYEGGLTPALSRKWTRILEKKGRVPYILYPNMCCKCGKLWPEMFNVSDKEWEKYIELEMQDEMLCEECYAQIKKWISDAEEKRDERSGKESQ